MRFAALADEVEALDVHLDSAALAELLRLQDRLAAKVAAAVGEFGASEEWAADGAISLGAWLRHRGRLAAADAVRLARTSARLRSAPGLRDAWLSGEVASGHVRAVVANVSEATAPVFTDHEREIVPALASLDPVDAPAFMREWRLRAEALVDPAEVPEGPVRSLFHSRTLECRSVMNGSFDPEAAAIIDTALGLATDADDSAGDGDRVRLPAERRADALVDVCRHFLDHQQDRRGGRHRPHLNVIVPLDAVEGRGQGRLVDGTPLDATTVQRLLCDCGIHRVVTRGGSQVLDYGRTTRTISPAMWATLVLRDRHCRAPGCDRRPDMCEAHHVIPWQQGGSTDQHNLALLCTRHHHVFHQPGWKLTLGPGARLEVIDPRGRHHSTNPPHW